MQALKLDAVEGMRWIATGWRLFRRQPFAFMATLLLFWMVLFAVAVAIGFVAQVAGAALPGLSPDVLEGLGSLVFAVFTPALTVGYLQACRVAESGLPVHPVLLFAPLRAPRATILRLVALGAIQAIALAAIGVATSPPASAPTPPAATAAATAGTRTVAADRAPTPADDADAREMRAKAAEVTKQGLAYLPVALLTWYAPMLVAWHGVPVGKALFFNLVGVWRNRGAFVVYFVSWTVIWMLASIAIALVAAAVGVGNVAAVVIAPLLMVVLTCMYCSIYRTYATVYVDGSNAVTAAPPTT